MSSYFVKIVLRPRAAVGNSLAHKVPLKDVLTLEKLRAVVLEALKSEGMISEEDEPVFKLRYVDDDGDSCIIIREQDWSMARGQLCNKQETVEIRTLKVWVVRNDQKRHHCRRFLRRPQDAEAEAEAGAGAEAPQAAREAADLKPEGCGSPEGCGKFFGEQRKAVKAARMEFRAERERILSDANLTKEERVKRIHEAKRRRHAAVQNAREVFKAMRKERFGRGCGESGSPRRGHGHGHGRGCLHARRRQLQQMIMQARMEAARSLGVVGDPNDAFPDALPRPFAHATDVPLPYDDVHAQAGGQPPIGIGYPVPYGIYPSAAVSTNEEVEESERRQAQAPTAEQEAFKKSLNIAKRQAAELSLDDDQDRKVASKAPDGAQAEDDDSFEEINMPDDSDDAADQNMDEAVLTDDTDDADLGGEPAQITISNDGNRLVVAGVPQPSVAKPDRREVRKMKRKLKELAGLGFVDEALNVRLLTMHDGDLNAVVNMLLEDIASD